MIFDYLDEKLPSYSPNDIPDVNKYEGLVTEKFIPKVKRLIDKNDPRRKSLAWRLVYPDKRGKHNREYRAMRKARLESWAQYLNPMVTCPNCGTMDYQDTLFTNEHTCTACGIQSEDTHIFVHYRKDHNSTSFVAPQPIFSSVDRVLTNIVSYDPVFYLKEGLNNWRCICPNIPNEHFKLIIQEILHSVGRTRGFSAECLTRTLIYNAVNRLFGAAPWKPEKERIRYEQENRKFLVYRERWLYIKKWMCEQSVFDIPDAGEWLERYRGSEPNEFLIERIESMMKVIHKAFKSLGPKKGNMPRRDVCILFLLYGLHPGFIALYGTDFWKPPTTEKSRRSNSQRFKRLLSIAKEMDPLNYWPDDSITLDEIEAIQEVQIEFDTLPLEISFMLPCVFEKDLITREEYRLF